MRTPSILAGLVVAVLASVGRADDPKPKAAPKLTPEQAMAEARARWNKVAQGVKAPVPGGGTVEFLWEEDRFPHPTFKGGSAEAYGAFARLLVKFLDEKGNFDFLAENDLFTAPLPYAKLKVDWTFTKLINDLSQPKAHGDHDEATRKALKGYADRIAARAKKDKP